MLLYETESSKLRFSRRVTHQANFVRHLWEGPTPQVIPWPARSTNLQSAWKNLHTNEVSSWHDDTEIAVDELRIWPGINLQQKWALHDLTLILNSFGERGLRPELRPGKWAQRLLITGCGCLDTGERHCRGEKPKQTSPGRFMNGPKFKE